MLGTTTARITTKPSIWFANEEKNHWMYKKWNVILNRKIIQSVHWSICLSVRLSRRLSSGLANQRPGWSVRLNNVCVQIFHRLFSRLSVTNFHYLHFNVNILLNKSVRSYVCALCVCRTCLFDLLCYRVVYSLIDEYIYMVIKQCLNVGKYVDMSVRSSICLTVCLSAST